MGKFLRLKEFPGYVITENGEVISYKRAYQTTVKQYINSSGQPTVQLYVDNTKHTVLVRDLLDATFTGSNYLIDNEEYTQVVIKDYLSGKSKEQIAYDRDISVFSVKKIIKTNNISRK